MSPLKLIKWLLVDAFTFYGGGKGGGKSQTVTQQTEIPAELKPLVRQTSNITGNALGQLASRIMGSGGGLRLPQGARVENGRVVRDIAAPASNNSDIVSTSTGFGRAGVLGIGEIPIGTRRTQRGPFGGTQTQTVDLGPVSQFRQPGNDPNLVAGFDPIEEEALRIAEARARGEGGFIPTAQDVFLRTAQGLSPSDDNNAFNALNETAGGSFLFGNEGFNEAVDAALRRVQPSILSTFGSGGRLDSGLAQQAIAQAASDAFAGLFNNERARQLGASGDLLNRQFQAASALPDVALLDASILSDVGGTRRGMAQRQIDAPITALERLISASQGTIPATSLLGQSTTQPLFRNRGAGILGGASAGLGLGAMTAAEGATGLAALGGPLGIGLGVGGALLGGLLS